MHGLIHVVLKAFILERMGGQEVWDRILQELSVADDSAILDLETQYDDATTVASVTAAAKVLGVEFDDALRAYGGYFVEYVHAGGHLRMLRSMGDSLVMFLGNINSLHVNLERKFREANFPYFSVSHVDEQGFRLSYLSSRGTALAALVEGVLPQLAASIFHHELSMAKLDTTDEGFVRTWQVAFGEAVAESEAPGETREGAEKWHSALMPTVDSTDGDDSAAEGVPRVQTTIHLDAMIDRDEIPQEDLDKLDQLEAQVLAEPTQAGHLLMRSCRAANVAAEWDEEDPLNQAAAFWGSNAGSLADFALSSTTEVGAKRFVTHSWNPPHNWEEVMGKSCSCKFSPLLLFFSFL